MTTRASSTAQPIGIFQIGGGYYVRSSALWTFDFESDGSSASS